MALRTVVEDLNTVDAAHQGLYVEQTVNGKTVHVLDVEGVDGHPSVANLKSAYERVKVDKTKLANDLRDVQTRLSGLPEDFDPDEYERLRQEDEHRRNNPDEADVQKRIDAAREAGRQSERTAAERAVKKASDTAEEQRKAREKAEGEVRRLLVTNGLRTVFTNLGVKKGLIDAAIAQHEGAVEVVEEEGRSVARMKADLGGDTLEKYFENWSQSEPAKDYIEPARGADETGAKTPARPGEVNPFSKQGWSKSAQARAVKENGTKAASLAKAAGFKTLDAAVRASGPAA